MTLFQISDGRNLDYRCEGVISLAGVGAFNQPDLDFLAGMGPEDFDEFGVATAGLAALEAWMLLNAVPMQNVTGQEIRDAFGGPAGRADREVLEGVVAENIPSAMERVIPHLGSAIETPSRMN
jgi:hypothetical protein